MVAGTFTNEPPAEVLRALAHRRATGCLRIERDGGQATVHFRDGSVYTAQAPGARARLGDRLVGAGHVTEEQLADTLAAQRTLAEPRRIGELLLERGLIDRETLRTYVREQITDSVTVTLGWTDATWTFDEGEEVSEDVPLDMSVENLLMEGARRLQQRDLIVAALGSHDAVVDFAEGDPAELALTPDEWAMLTRIDGVSTVAEIADAAGYGRFDAERIVYGLLTAGVVTVVDRGTPETADVPPPTGDGLDRKQLLREFAALDEPAPSAPPVPAAPEQTEERPPARKPAPPPAEPERRRGLFRRRRD